MNRNDDFVAWCLEMDMLFEMAILASNDNRITWGSTALSDLDNETLRALFNLVRTPDDAAGFPHIAQAYFDAQQAIRVEFKKRGIPPFYSPIRLVVDNVRPGSILAASPEGPKAAGVTDQP